MAYCPIDDVVTDPLTAVVWVNETVGSRLNDLSLPMFRHALYALARIAESLRRARLEDAPSIDVIADADAPASMVLADLVFRNRIRPVLADLLGRPHAPFVRLIDPHGRATPANPYGPLSFAALGHSPAVLLVDEIVSTWTTAVLWEEAPLLGHAEASPLVVAPLSSVVDHAFALLLASRGRMAAASPPAGLAGSAAARLHVDSLLAFLEGEEGIVDEIERVGALRTDGSIPLAPGYHVDTRDRRVYLSDVDPDTASIAELFPCSPPLPEYLWPHPAPVRGSLYERWSWAKGVFDWMSTPPRLVDALA